MTRTVLVLGALCIGACSQASETELSAAGAAIAKLPNVKLPKKQIPHHHVPTQINRCPSAPDLAVQPVTADSRGFKGWLYVCSPVKNAGGRAWSSNSNQVGLSFTSTIPGSTAGRASGFSSLAVNATVNRCGWVRAPGLLRTGHDTPRYGECKATKAVTASLSFDPDIRIDGNTANDDCLSSNNRRSATVNYMVECPW